MSRKMMLWERVVFGTFSEEAERKEPALSQILLRRL